MPSRRLPQLKRNAIRKLFIEGDLKAYQVAERLKINYSVVYHYFQLFKQIKLFCPERLFDMNFYFQVHRKKQEPSVAYLGLVELLPKLVAEDQHKRLTASKLWQRYKADGLGTYSESQFHNVCGKWLKDNFINQFVTSRVRFIAAEDLKILSTWRNATDHRQWQKAVVIMDSYRGTSLVDLAAKVEATIEAVENWVMRYKKGGIAAIERKPWTLQEKGVLRIQERTDNLMKLIHQTPKLHGIERTSWKTDDLSAVYFQVYGSKMSRTTILKYLANQGFNFRKAREVLTSPDKNFEEKLTKVIGIVSTLGPNDKFFSIDELGPVGIRLKGGWSYQKHGESKTIPAHAKAKGYLVCNAALELATNQITHFYSTSKNTDEMIKLLDMLLVQYPDADKLWLSWDAASWHASKKLKNYIEDLNTTAYRELHKSPWIGLSPLPSSAQFLNVIESVFSGLAKSVLHHSDYENVDECKLAIDGYFKQRNDYYVKNPKRAGKKIWGKELVEPVFNASNNCKDPRARS